MNKQEAINQIKLLKARETFMSETIWIKQDDVIGIVRKIHEQQKVVVPKVIGDLIKELQRGEYTIGEIGANVYDDEEQKWIDNNEELFYRAWLDGYEVEKEQLYVVTDGNKLYLKQFDELDAVIIIDDVVGAIDYAKRYSDKTEAQKAADELGWVVKEME
ncbi:TPA: DUF1642 domain-containing protein [Streptococcus suis]|nr:DUF1642 domain-containing protein [Streptococcus suis]